METEKSGAKPCSSSSTPIAPNVQFSKEGELFRDFERYRRLVGKLNYLTATRPYIAYSMSIVSRYISFPTINHWAAMGLLELGCCIRIIGIPKLSVF